MAKLILGFLLCIELSQAFYEDNDDVYELTAMNFGRLVTSKSDKIWLIQFYTEWCRKKIEHFTSNFTFFKFAGRNSKHFAREFKIAAKKLKDKVDFGVVDCSKQESLKKKFNINSYPSLYIYNGQTLNEYLGELTANEIIKEVKKYLQSSAEEQSEF